MRSTGLVCGRHAFGPVAAVLSHVLFGIRIGSDVVFRNHNPGRFAAGTRQQLEFHRRWSGAAHLGEVFHQLIFKGADQRERRLIQARRVTVDPNTLHYIDDVAPAIRIKLVLKHEIGLMAAGTIISKDRFHSSMFECVLRESHHPFRSGELSGEIFDGLEREISLRFRSAEIDLRAAGFKADSLRPNAVVTFVQRREVVAAVVVGKDTGCDSLPICLGRNDDSFQYLTRCRFDRAGQNGTRRCTIRPLRTGRKRHQRGSAGRNRNHGHETKYGSESQHVWPPVSLQSVQVGNDAFDLFGLEGVLEPRHS